MGVVEWFQKKQVMIGVLVIGFIGVMIGYHIERDGDSKPCDRIRIPNNAMFISLSNSKLAEIDYHGLVDQEVAMVAENHRKNLRCRIHFRSAKLVRGSNPVILKISPLDAAVIYRSLRRMKKTSLAASLAQMQTAENLPACGSDSRVQYAY